MSVSYSFKKHERLSSRRAISNLFESGEAFTLYPFRVFWIISDDRLPSPVQVAFSASKKNFKNAVDRNRIKRLTREAWRHNKHRLFSQLEKTGKQLTIMLVYTESSMPGKDLINNKVEDVVSKLLVLLPD